MFERFSRASPARRGQRAGRGPRAGPHYIGTEHLLLGLLVVLDSVANASLRPSDTPVTARGPALRRWSGGARRRPAGTSLYPAGQEGVGVVVAEALQLKHNYIGTEHILLGLVREGEGRAAQILAARHPLDRVRAEVLARVEVSPGAGGAHAGSRAPAAHEVLTLAAELAGDTPVGSHHILEAILQQPNSAAAKVLTDAGIDSISWPPNWTRSA